MSPDEDAEEETGVTYLEDGTPVQVYWAPDEMMLYFADTEGQALRDRQAAYRLALSQGIIRKERHDGRPLVLLDVDGVLNLGRFLSSRQRARLPGRDGWHNCRAGDRHDPYAARIVINRRWGPMLRSLEDEGAELAWATGWQRDANMFISPLLGLGSLQWAPAVHGRKARTVIPWTQGRPWAWFEDNGHELEEASALSKGRPHCPVLVDRATGLTEVNVEAVRQWLKSL